MLSDDYKASVEIPVDLGTLVKRRVYAVTAQYVDDISGRRDVGRQVSGMYRGQTTFRHVRYRVFESEMMMHFVDEDYIVEVKEVKQRWML